MNAPANYSHQEGLFETRYAKKTVVFGAGSVGGYVPIYLGGMGVKDIEVWDADSVASHNIPMSVYRAGNPKSPELPERPSDVGRLKVHVLREIVAEKTGIIIKVFPEMYTGQTKLKNVSVISCVDTMSARRDIWKRVKKNPSIHLFCDTRVAEYYLEVLAIAPCDPQDIKRYEALLCDDKDTKRQMCGMHGTPLVASRAANIAVQNLTTFWQTGQKKWRVAERCDTLARVF